MPRDNKNWWLIKNNLSGIIKRTHLWDVSHFKNVLFIQYVCWFWSKEEKKLNFTICFTNLWRKEIRKNVSILPIKCLCIVYNILLENYFHVCLGNSFQRWSLSVPSDGWKSPSVTLLAVKCTVSEKNTDSVMNNTYVVCYSPTFTF